MKRCKCGVEHDRNHAYCLSCHREYMRQFRKYNPLTEEQKLRDNCRSYAGVYKRRGKLIQEPCVICGNQDSEMHHEDYTKPLEVIWMCRDCHLNHHQEG